MTSIDSLSYYYFGSTNRLASTSDATNNIAGFNVNGNLFSDPYKKISSLKYYYNNLTKDIAVIAGGTIKMTYNESGQKLRKEVYNSGNFVIAKQDYLGSIELSNGTIEAIHHSEGRAVWQSASSSFRYEYNVKDHLGNVRAVVSDLNNNGVLDIANNEIINQTDYYPFGMMMNNPALSNNTTTPDTKYQYNGKEFNADLGLNLLDYGARWYDPAVGRFTSVDPLAEKYKDMSPYNYTINNPISNVDPNGMDVYLFYHVKSENKEDNAMFWNSTLSHARALISSGEIGEGDQAVYKSIQDLGTLETDVETTINTLSCEFGQTKEFGIWSHSGLDGLSEVQVLVKIRYMTVQLKCQLVDGEKLILIGNVMEHRQQDFMDVILEKILMEQGQENLLQANYLN
jgi:RHS repeat-associated protein